MEVTFQLVLGTPAVCTAQAHTGTAHLWGSRLLDWQGFFTHVLLVNFSLFTLMTLLTPGKRSTAGLSLRMVSGSGQRAGEGANSWWQTPPTCTQPCTARPLEAAPGCCY